MVASASGGGGDAAVPAKRAKAPFHPPYATTMKLQASPRLKAPMRLPTTAQAMRTTVRISPVRFAPNRRWPAASGGRAAAGVVVDAAVAAVRKMVWPDR